jgi:hypothetical protein
MQLFHAFCHFFQLGNICEGLGVQKTLILFLADVRGQLDVCLGEIV